MSRWFVVALFTIAVFALSFGPVLAAIAPP
jgi:hypothetical protein